MQSNLIMCVKLPIRTRPWKIKPSHCAITVLFDFQLYYVIVCVCSKVFLTDVLVCVESIDLESRYA